MMVEWLRPPYPENGSENCLKLGEIFQFSCKILRFILNSNEDSAIFESFPRILCKGLAQYIDNFGNLQRDRARVRSHEAQT